MIAFLARRLIQALASLLVITFLVFGMLYRTGDPVAELLPPTASPMDRERLRTHLGLDKPFIVQYGMFLERTARLDFGTSYYQGRPVIDLLIERFPATLELAIASLLIATLIGIPLGIWTAARPRSWISRFAMGGSILGISLPTFWLGLLLMTTFGVSLHWLPTDGRGPTRPLGPFRFSFLTAEGWKHLIMPAATLSLHHLAMLMRLVRSELLDTLRLPFIRVARSRGLPERAIVLHHAMRHTLIPIVTVTGVEFGQLLAFSVVTETIFSWPGLGKLLIDSVYVDRPVVLTYLLLTGIVFLALNFLVDMTYALIDPRIRLATRSVGAA